MTVNRLVAFPWYGGKTAHLSWLLPIIDNIPHKTYVESFGGSAAVLLNKISSPVEIYNDLYGDVVNFFQVLRNQRDELITLLELTPYSREEFAEVCGDSSGEPLERARKFFIRARQVRNGLASIATPGRWCYTKKDSCRTMALPVARWLKSIEMLYEVCERLKEVQIENLDALDVIERYDTENTLHYVDPPYLEKTRSCGGCYAHEYSEEKHLELLNLLKKMAGKVLLSGYQNEMYSDILTGWSMYKAEAKISSSTKQKNCTPSLRQEVLWRNFQ